MKTYCEEISALEDASMMERFEDKYDIDFPESYMVFIKENNGGIPYNRFIEVDGEAYEVRCFLSFNDDEYNSIRKPLDYFQNETKGKIVPIAVDSGDNYFCMNLETEKIYYWTSSSNLYYLIAESFEGFLELMS